ncbi:MAG: proprotein convertase P-domain-containing protein [Thermoanaerobaculia bacterium]
MKTLKQIMKTLESLRPTRLAVIALASLGILAAGIPASAQTTVTCSTAVGSTNCFAQIPDAYDATGVPQTYTSGILDSVLVVPASACASGTVAAVTAQVKLKHTWVGDLIVTLIHPNGATSAILLNRPNAAAPSNCSRDDVDATFQDGAGTSAATACNFTIPAVSGLVAPIGPLAAFSGLAGAGNWTLRVQDANGGEYGYLEDWALTLTCGAIVPPPVVSISASVPTAFFPGQNGQFTVTRSGATTAALLVNYTVGGTAASGIDYVALTGSVTIPIGSSSAVITVSPLLVPPSARTVIATLTASALYTIGNPSATVTILAAPTAQPIVQVPALSPMMLMLLGGLLGLAGMLVLGSGRFRG